MNEPCKVLVADCPWSFNDALPGPGRGAIKHYNTMTLGAICNYLQNNEIQIADTAHLFLWRVSAMVEEAYRVVRAWGFVPKSEIVWQKLTTNGKHWFGMGSQVRASHETCIIATKGKGAVAVDRSIRSTFEAKVPDGRHSAKPEEFFDIVEKLCPVGPYVELFARRQRPNWLCYGDQVNG